MPRLTLTANTIQPTEAGRTAEAAPSCLGPSGRGLMFTIAKPASVGEICRPGSASLRRPPIQPSGFHDLLASLSSRADTVEATGCLDRPAKHLAAPPLRSLDDMSRAAKRTRQLNNNQLWPGLERPLPSSLSKQPLEQEHTDANDTIAQWDSSRPAGQDRAMAGPAWRPKPDNDRSCSESSDDSIQLE
ncbi:unnamed protein product, partial [Protopolystoma xenopodis]